MIYNSDPGSGQDCIPYSCVLSNTQRNLALTQHGGHLHLCLIGISTHHHSVLQFLPSQGQKEQITNSQVFVLLYAIKLKHCTDGMQVMSMVTTLLFPFIPSTELHPQVEIELQQLNARHCILSENNHGR